MTKFIPSAEPKAMLKISTNSSPAPFMEIETKDGRKATIDISSGNVTFGGDLNFDEAAQQVFQCLAQIGAFKYTPASRTASEIHKILNKNFPRLELQCNQATKEIMDALRKQG